MKICLQQIKNPAPGGTGNGANQQGKSPTTKDKEIVRMELVIVNNGIPTTTTLAIAEGTGNQHKNVLELVRNYISDLEQFGRVAFETQPFETAGGTQSREIANLNERQATLIMSYMKNTVVIRKFKTQLVKSFYELAEQKPSLPTDPIMAQIAILQSVREQQLALQSGVQVLAVGISETRNDVNHLKQNMRVENWQQCNIKTAVHHKAAQFQDLYPSAEYGDIIRKIWRFFKNKFSIPRYQELPAMMYEEAMKTIHGLAMHNLAGL